MAAPTAAVQDAAAVAGLGGYGGLFGGLGAFLSPRERDASLRFRRPADRLDYPASHALFRLLAARRLGLSPAAAAGLSVRRMCAGCGATDHGKPSIEGVALSMSRSHGTVMAAAAPAGTSLGADIERVPAEVFAGFDNFALAPEERRGPDGPGLAGPELTGPGLTDAGRIRLWVAKEAALKAAGVGLAVDPSSVRLVPAGSGAWPAHSWRNARAIPRSTASSPPRSRHPTATPPPSPPPPACLRVPCHLPRYSPLKGRSQTSNV